MLSPQLLDNPAMFNQRCNFFCDRGAIEWSGETVCVFGNDGFQQSEWVQREVALLRTFLQRTGLEEADRLYLDGVENYSWSLLVCHDDSDYLEAVIHLCHLIATVMSERSIRQMAENHFAATTIDRVLDVLADQIADGQP
jgi:hypothetical protein